jgi:predicted alpha/beta-hydrolase family hydrolase
MAHVRMAAVQDSPVLLDRAATLDLVDELAHGAAASMTMATAPKPARSSVRRERYAPRTVRLVRPALEWGRQERSSARSPPASSASRSPASTSSASSTRSPPASAETVSAPDSSALRTPSIRQR